jgi:hypothetical protein
MIKPRVWTKNQLNKQRKIAIDVFRAERMREPLKKYLDEFDRRQKDIENLLARLIDMTDLGSIDDQTVLEILGEKQFLDAFRYLSAPPISTDDLKELADAPSLSVATLRENPTVAKSVFQTVLQGLDSRRFPWVASKRAPTETERNAAVVASAALLATQRVATDRRNQGKSAQEGAVIEALRKAGFTNAPTRAINTLDDAPEPGQFCAESMLGGRKADIVVRLHDKRVLAIECKVSNSSTNSIKRLNNDAAAKAGAWTSEFGTRQLIPSAMLSGVFKLRNLLDAQDRNLTLWWAHDLPAFVK